MKVTENLSLEVFRKDDITVEGVVISVVVSCYVLKILQFIYLFNCEKMFHCIDKYNINSYEIAKQCKNIITITDYTRKKIKLI